jgi:PadR family transcriptional regulator AphA
MTTRIIDSDLSLAMLGLLSIRKMSGYDLRKVFLATAMSHFSASPGAIYPALHRLAKTGFIKGAVERPDTLRPRMVYRLTEAGALALKKELLGPVTRDDVVRRMDRLLLRFSFMNGLVDVEDTLEFLHGMVRETEGYLQVLEKEFRMSGPGLTFTGRAALGQGVEGFRATVRWARKTCAALESQHASPGDAR